mmetsp:Transcript_57197/g.150527  ORF Transcript_57197/g.150527 Transcript_57197/m.150527 type:complete len:387 (+) Transcript_57197:256-1416(+)
MADPHYPEGDNQDDDGPHPEGEAHPCPCERAPGALPRGREGVALPAGGAQGGREVLAGDRVAHRRPPTGLGQVVALHGAHHLAHAVRLPVELAAEQSSGAVQSVGGLAALLRGELVERERVVQQLGAALLEGDRVGLVHHVAHQLGDDVHRLGGNSRLLRRQDEAGEAPPGGARHLDGAARLQAVRVDLPGAPRGAHAAEDEAAAVALDLGPQVLEGEPVVPERHVEIQAGGLDVQPARRDVSHAAHDRIPLRRPAACQPDGVGVLEGQQEGLHPCPVRGHLQVLQALVVDDRRDHAVQEVEILDGAADLPGHRLDDVQHVHGGKVRRTADAVRERGCDRAVANYHAVHRGRLPLMMPRSPGPRPGPRSPRRGPARPSRRLRATAA